MFQQTVSLCMIVKDEEHFLRRCLESVSNQVDEIIIVDTGSVDSTINIAEEFGAKIFNYQWLDDFADARNFSIRNATSNYVLVLDADEYLDKDTRIQDTIKTGNDYYIINFKNYMDGGYVSNHQAIRLFKNNRGLKYIGKIHEHLNIDELNDCTVSFAEFIVHHDGYNKKTYTSKNKFERNLKILSKEVSDHPTGYNLFNLGVQQKVGGKYHDALITLKKSFTLSKDQIYLPYLLFVMGECLLELGRNREGIRLMNDSIELFPNYTGYFYLNGMFYENLNYLKAAEDAFKKCLDMGEVKHFQSLEGVGSYLAYIKLSKIQQKQGKLIEALDSSFASIKLYKKFPPAINQYFFVMRSARIDERIIDENLRKIVPIEDANDLENLIRVFYANKSSLLLSYLTNYKINILNEDLAMAYLYAKKYEKAINLFENEAEFNPELFSDILSLAIICKNESLFLKVLQQMNLNKIERKTLISIFKEDKFIKKSSLILELLKKVVINLLILQEENLAYGIFEKLSLNTVEKEDFLSMIIHYGYLDEALIILEKEVSDADYKLIALLADIYVRQNKLNDAHALYQSLIGNYQEYSIYNRLYCLYDKINYTEGLKRFESDMKIIMLKELKS